MNKVYKVVKNKIGLAVVSENVKGRGKTTGSCSSKARASVSAGLGKLSVLAVSVLLAMGYTVNASALPSLPSGGSYNVGTGTISTSGTTETVAGTDTSSTGGVVNDIINWSGGFDVASGNTVDFTSANTGGANVINIDGSGVASDIAGTVTAGTNVDTVVVVNPDGMTINGTASLPSTFLGVAGTSQSTATNEAFTLTNAPIDVTGAPTVVNGTASSATSNTNTLPNTVMTVNTSNATAPFEPNAKPALDWTNVGDPTYYSVLVPYVINFTSNSILAVPNYDVMNSGGATLESTTSSTATINFGTNDNMDLSTMTNNQMPLVLNLGSSASNDGVYVANSYTTTPSVDEPVTINMANTQNNDVIASMAEPTGDSGTIVNLSGTNTGSSIYNSVNANVSPMQINISGNTEIGGINNPVGSNPYGLGYNFSTTNLNFASGSSLTTDNLSFNGLAVGSSLPTINLNPESSGLYSYTPQMIYYSPNANLDFTGWTINSGAAAPYGGGSLGLASIILNADSLDNENSNTGAVSLSNLTVNAESGATGYLGNINFTGYTMGNQSISGITAPDFIISNPQMTIPVLNLSGNITGAGLYLGGESVAIAANSNLVAESEYITLNASTAGLTVGNDATLTSATSASSPYNWTSLMSGGNMTFGTGDTFNVGYQLTMYAGNNTATGGNLTTGASDTFTGGSMYLESYGTSGTGNNAISIGSSNILNSTGTVYLDSGSTSSGTSDITVGSDTAIYGSAINMYAGEQAQGNTSGPNTGTITLDTGSSLNTGNGAVFNYGLTSISYNTGSSATAYDGLYNDSPSVTGTPTLNSTSGGPTTESNTTQEPTTTTIALFANTINSSGAENAGTPVIAPTAAPTVAPTSAPTVAPTAAPTQAPTVAPTSAPTVAPTPAPTQAPTAAPTVAPVANIAAIPHISVITIQPAAVQSIETDGTNVLVPNGTYSVGSSGVNVNDKGMVEHKK